jgi:hypothetical protein
VVVIGGDGTGGEQRASQQYRFHEAWLGLGINALTGTSLRMEHKTKQR